MSVRAVQGNMLRTCWGNFSMRQGASLLAACVAFWAQWFSQKPYFGVKFLPFRLSINGSEPLTIGTCFVESFFFSWLLYFCP